MSESKRELTTDEPKPTEWLEALNRAILSSALDCIITMDANGRVLEFNPAAERVFGYTRSPSRLYCGNGIGAVLRIIWQPGRVQFLIVASRSPRCAQTELRSWWNLLSLRFAFPALRLHCLLARRYRTGPDGETTRGAIQRRQFTRRLVVAGGSW